MQIEYGIYVPSDAAAMAKLLAEVFSRYDPPAIATGLTTSEFEAFVQLLCPRAAAEGLTVVARLAGTGELIAALLTEDSASPLPDGIDQLSAKFDPIFDILGQLDTENWGGRTVHPGESLHLFLLASPIASPAGEWRSNSSRLVWNMEHEEVIGWRSPRRRTRCRSTSSANRDSSRACSGLTRLIVSTDNRFLRRSLSTAVRY
jgi:hypothetical protein